MIRILYLCGDLMNMYGDNGNIKILTRRLNASGLQVEVVKSSPKEVTDWDFDLIYIGSGTERSLFAALEQLNPFKELLSRKIDDNTIVLATGNAISLLGSRITKNDGNIVSGLKILNLETEEDYERSVTTDCIFESALIEQPIVGFINRVANIYSNEKPLFNVKFGIGNNPDDKFEGVQKGNILATHLIGPLLVKNPFFLEFIVEKLARNSQKFDYELVIFEEAQNAYNVTLSELQKRI